MRGICLIGLIALGLLAVVSGCRGPYYYNLQVMNATTGRLEDVKLDWGDGGKGMGSLRYRGEDQLGPYMTKPPATCTLSWADERGAKSASADVPTVRENFNGTFFIMVMKDDTITVTAAEMADKETYRRLHEMMPDPTTL